MEQDIKRLKEKINNIKKYDTYRYDDWTETDVQTVEHLIKAYKELEEENKDLKNLANKKQWISPCYVAQNYIPVSLVEEKIEELKEEICGDDEYLGNRQCIELELLEKVQKKLLERRK